MQILSFDPSWEKAVSINDRIEIERIFLNTCNSSNSIIRYSPIREALNYRGELLVTVLVHNFTNFDISFDKKRLVYIEEEKVLADHIFILPKLILKPEVSMPWTFIFPVHSLKSLIYLR